MKYDLNKKASRVAKRTLDAFSETMFELISKKPFENIMVSEICEQSNYPRATFYNYFEDKYDLLNYCWILLSKEINIDKYQEIEEEVRLFEVFNRMYDLLDDNRKKVKSIIRANPIDGILVENFRSYLKSRITEIMKNCSCSKRYTIPQEMVAEHYSNTIILVIDWSFLRKEDLSKEQANEYLKTLLAGV